MVEIRRRKDHSLRKTINCFTQQVGHKPTISQVYHYAIRALAELSVSPIGLVVEQHDLVQQHASQDAYKCMAKYTHAAQQILPYVASECNVVGIHDSRFLNTIEQVFAEGVPQIVTHDSLNQAVGIACDWLSESIDQILLLPIARGQLVCGVMCLCNSQTPYTITMSQRFVPLLKLIAALRFQCDTLQTKFLGTHESTVEDLTWEDIFAKVEQQISTSFIEVNGQLEIIRMNQAAETVFHCTEKSMLRENIIKLIPEKFPNEHKIHTFNPISLLPKTQFNTQLIARKQGDVEFPIDLKVIHYQRHQQSYFLLLINDLTEIQKIKNEQAAQVQRFKAVADLAPVGILQTNSSWEAVYVNNRWCEICQNDESEIIGMGWVGAFHYEDVVSTLENLRAAVAQGNEFSSECRFHSTQEDVIWVEFLARPLFNQQGSVDGFLATLADCTYRHITEEKLRLMAERDTLTGLANRALFQDRLQHALERSHRHGSIALLCLDLDGFKNINDSLGHEAGDILLVSVARNIESCVRTEDTIARLGGDEFAILLEGLERFEIAAEIANKVLKALEKPFEIYTNEVFISTSIGITFTSSDEDTNTGKALLKQADIALYRAKAMGRNNFQYFSPDLEQASQQRMYLGNSLHRALDRGEFRVYYQLQADVKTSKIVGIEALLRWDHADKGILLPGEFLDILEETGLIISVSRWVWQEVFAQFKQWLTLGYFDQNSHVSVNLSPRQLKDESLVSDLMTAINDAELASSHVLIEITESALIDETPLVLQILKELRDNGLKIALDDFGTGYSSLTYLKRFPINYVKIDQTFIRDLLTDPEDAAITHAVVNLAHTLEMIVIAEGVDDLTKKMQLAEWGCDQFQGFILNKPCDYQATEKLLVGFQ